MAAFSTGAEIAELCDGKTDNFLKQSVRVSKTGVCYSVLSTTNQWHPADMSGVLNFLHPPMQRITRASFYILTFVAILSTRGPVVASGGDDMKAIVHQDDLDGWQVEGT